MQESKGLVLVTGAAKRLGRIISLHLAQEGWDIVIHYNTSQKEAEETAKEITGSGRQAYLIKADFSNLDETEHLVEKIKNNFGELSSIINNASLFKRDEFDPEGKKHSAINFQSPCIIAEKFFNSITKNKSGSIVNIVDSGPIPASFSFYLKSKNELASVTKEFAKKMAPKIRVNAVSLGPVIKGDHQSEENFDRLISLTPLESKIPPGAVASAIAFLLHNPAITGEIIHIDGGMHLISNMLDH